MMEYRQMQVKKDKELTHAREVIEDLQEELRLADERCLRLQEECDARDELVKKARDELDRIDEIVALKVAERLEEEMQRKEEVEALLAEKEETIKKLEEDQERLINREQMLMRDYEYIKAKLEETMGGNFEMQDALREMKMGKIEQAKKEEEIERLVAQLNELSKNAEDLIVENRVLREMAGVPENFGIAINEIKLAEREKIEDLKARLRVYEEQIHGLEKENISLKEQLRQRPKIMGREGFTEGLTGDQIIILEQLVNDLRDGKEYAPIGNIELKKENEQLKMQLIRLQRGKSVDFERAIEKAMVNKDQSISPDLEEDVIKKIQKENAELLKKIREMIKTGVIDGSAFGRSGVGNASKLTYPPQPIKKYDGSVVEGLSYRYPGIPLPIIPFNVPRYNTDRINKEEFAFLQLALIEAIELSCRKDKELKLYTTDFQKIRVLIKNYLLQRNELYKDYAEAVSQWQSNEKQLKEQNAELLDFLRAEKIKNNDLENLLSTLKNHLRDSEVRQRLIEETKKASILEVTMMQLTRKYMTLENEYKLLHSQYMTMEKDHKGAILELEQCITRLREWKSKAVLELRYLYDRLRSSVSLSRYDYQKRELDSLKEKEMQWLEMSQELMLLKSDRVGIERARVECEEALRETEELLGDADQELQLVQSKLKQKDPRYAYERAVLGKIVERFKMYRTSPQRLFEDYDKGHTGSISKDDFKEILELLNLDLSTTDFEITMKFVDSDAIGMIRYKSFLRLLKRYGVKEKRKEEEIIIKIAERLKQSNVNIQKAFELIDRDRNSLINKQEMMDALVNMKLGIREDELMNVINFIYPEGITNIDYRRFCRVFEKSMLSLVHEEQKGQEKWKLSALQKIDEALMEKRIALKEAFMMTVEGNVTKEEFARVCSNLNIDLSYKQVEELYNDLDKRKIGIASFTDIATEIISAKASKGTSRVYGDDIAYDVRKYKEEDDIEAMRMKIKMLQERERVVLDALSRETEQTKILQQTLKKRTEEIDNLERDYLELSRKHSKVTEDLLAKDNKLANCISREESIKLKQKYEITEKELLDKEAAMHTYKSMYEALLQQMKSLELALGRRLDESLELHKTLLSLQSKDDTKNLIGKLYFVIMLSRWQEGNTNRKYEAALTSSKWVNTRLYTAETENAKKDDTISHLEALLRDTTEIMSQLNDKVNEGQNTEYTKEKVRELNGRMRELIQTKIDIELVNIELREKNINLAFLVNQLEVEKKQARELADVLRYSNDSEIARKYAELSDKVGAIRLSELRAQRDAKISKEKEVYTERINSEALQQIQKLEEELEQALNELQKTEEAFREKDKERERLFFQLKKTKDIPIEEEKMSNVELINLLKKKDEVISELKGKLRESSIRPGEYKKMEIEVMQDEKQREMANIAYKTIKTLEDIITNQKEQLKRKENFIQEMKENNQKLHEESMKEIAQLQRDLAIETKRNMKELGTINKPSKETHGRQDDTKKAKEIESLRAKNEELEEKLAGIIQDDKAARLQRELTKVKKELTKRNTEYNGLKTTIQKLKSEFNERSEAQIKDKEEMALHASREKESQQAKTSLEEELKRTKEELEKAREEQRKAQDKVTEAQKKRIELKNEIQRLNSELEQEKANSQQLFKAKEEQKSILQQPIKEEVKGSPEINSLKREIEKLRQEVVKYKLERYNKPIKELRVNMEKGIIESTITHNIEELTYIDDIIQAAKENIRSEIEPIEVFEAYSDEADYLFIDYFDTVCEKLGLKFDFITRKALLDVINPDNGKIEYRKLAHAFKGVLFKEFMDEEMYQLGRIAVEMNISHKELAKRLNNIMASKEDIESAIQILFNITSDSPKLSYVLNRVKNPIDDHYNSQSLFNKLETAIQTYLIEMIREKMKTAELIPDELFIEFDTDYDRKISRAELDKLLNRIKVRITSNMLDYLIVDSMSFEYYCQLLYINPNTSNFLLLKY